VAAAATNGGTLMSLGVGRVYLMFYKPCVSLLITHLVSKHFIKLLNNPIILRYLNWSKRSTITNLKKLYFNIIPINKLISNMRGYILFINFTSLLFLFCIITWIIQLFFLYADSRNPIMYQNRGVLE